MKNRPLSIYGVNVQPGERVTLALPTPEIYTCTPLHIPIHVIHGKRQGPILLVCATFHGDEINGISVLQRLLNLKFLKKLQGTLIAVPVMNVYGLINHSHLLPDGRDLSKSFPGTESGSFASRMAYLFSSEIFSLCTHCIMIQTGGLHTYKVPNVMYHKESKESEAMAKAFEAPILAPSPSSHDFILNPKEKPIIIYEGGENNRTDEYSVRIGVKGITKVMRDLGLVKFKQPQRPRGSYTIDQSTWIHASGSGLLHLRKKFGSFVRENETIATITDPFGTSQEYSIVASKSGVITAMNTYPLVYEGQGIVEIGHFEEGLQPPIELEIPDMPSEPITYESIQ